MTDPNNLNECFPLETLTAVLEWEPPCKPNWARRVEAKVQRTPYVFPATKNCHMSTKGSFDGPLKSAPKTLVCHDMKGGYLEDRYLMGSGSKDAFKFHHWPYLDIFVYFSHKLVTIPPLSWINAGHRNGVSVLGTIISEHEEGKAIWEEIFSSDLTMDIFCTNLAQICNYYKFDGYLLNVENAISLKNINKMLSFVTTLNTLLKSLNKDAVLIWYDSISCKSGELKWQNQLNVNNSAFFDACDGIFLNYCWNTETLEKSLKMADRRSHDVFVGIDVFGRNCYGGGGFSCNMAFEVIRSFGLSVALFAPGWVHENCPSGESILERDLLFWSLIYEYMFASGPAELPFKTSFCRGYGDKYFENGTVMRDEFWHNLAIQNFQPLGPVCHQGGPSMCLSYFTDDAYHGGGCLLINKPEEAHPSPHIHRLFVCGLKSPTTPYLCLRLVTKPLHVGSKPGLDIVLVMRNFPDKEKSPGALEWTNIQVLKYVTSEVHSYENWTESSFDLNTKDGQIVEIGVCLSGDSSPLLLGELSVCEKTENRQEDEPDMLVSLTRM